VEESEIVVGVVEDHFHRPILEHSSEPRWRIHAQGVYDCTALRRRQLEEIDAVDESVKARAFGIQREDAGMRDRPHEVIDCGGRVEVEKRRSGVGRRARRRCLHGGVM
jgi:hypothetical protein